VRLPDRVRVLGARATFERTGASDEIRGISPSSRLAAGKVQLDFRTELSIRRFRFDRQEPRRAGGLLGHTGHISNLRGQTAGTRYWSRRRGRIGESRL